MKNKIENYADCIKLNTDVVDIDTSSDQILVKTEPVDASQPTRCQDYKANHVIFTPGVGVLNTRGDDKYKTSMFSPHLPGIFMDALRKTFFFSKNFTDPTADRRRRMSVYKELFVQFGEKVNLKKELIPNANYFFIETEERRQGNIWQVYDRTPNKFYDNSKTFVGDLSTEVYETIANAATLDVDEDKAKDLIKNTLNKALKLPDTLIENCFFVEPFNAEGPNPLSLTSPTTANDLGEDCVWQVFDKSNPGWEGAWSAYTAEDWKEEYELLQKPLADGKLWFGGEAFCIRYSGYMHGAWLSGLEQVNKLLSATLSPGDYAAWEPYATEYNCAYGENSDIFHQN